MREVRSAAVAGGMLAVLILLLFLRNLRATVIIATSIPLSVLFTFMAMYRMDISLNIMSLGGLTLGVGMLVDNAIVVLEAIHRKVESGEAFSGALADYPDSFSELMLNQIRVGERLIVSVES